MLEVCYHTSKSFCRKNRRMIRVYGSLLKKQKLDYLLGRKKNVNGNYQKNPYIIKYLQFETTTDSLLLPNPLTFSSS